MSRMSFVAVLAAVLAGCGGAEGSIGPTVLIGDSITYLWDDSTWTATPDLISSHIANVIDVGVSGQTCPQMWARFQTDVLDQHPRVVVINCGTNDVFHLGSLDSEVYLFQMVTAAQAAGARVIVETCPPDAYAPGSAGWLLHEAWNAAIVNGAPEYGYRLADYYQAMMLADGTRNEALFAPGSAHPDSQGYAVMWPILARQL